MYKITTHSVISRSNKELKCELLIQKSLLKIHKEKVAECIGSINIYNNEIKSRTLVLKNYMYGVSPFMDYIHNKDK